MAVGQPGRLARFAVGSVRRQRFRCDEEGVRSPDRSTLLARIVRSRREARNRLPDYAFKMMRTRLKVRVFYYRSAEPDIEIRAKSNAKEVVEQSVWRLSQLEGLSAEDLTVTDIVADSRSGHRFMERYRRVDPEQFLEDMGACFENGG